MRKNRFILLFLVLVPFAYAQELRVSKIAIFGNEKTKAEVILGAFLEVSEGDTLSKDQLLAAADLARDRLVALDYFSSVLVAVIESRTVPGTARIVVEVVEGFEGRFGGGPVWGMAGLKNFGGEGQDGTLWLGLNRQAAGWTNLAPGWKGGSWSVEAGNDPVTWTDGSGNFRENQGLGAQVQIGQALGWGWTLEGDQSTRWERTDGSGTAMVRTAQGGGLQWSTAPPGFSPDHGQSANLRVHALFPGPLFRQEAEAKSYWNLGFGLKAALRVAASTQQGPFDDRDAQVLSGLEGLRKPFDVSDLARTKVWASAELRWSTPEWPLLGFTTLVEPALIADAGGAGGDSGSAWDVGGALRVYWGAPVEVPLRLEVTLDNKQRWWTGFGVEAPY